MYLVPLGMPFILLASVLGYVGFATVISLKCSYKLVVYQLVATLVAVCGISVTFMLISRI